MSAIRPFFGLVAGMGFRDLGLHQNLGKLSFCLRSRQYLTYIQATGRPVCYQAGGRGTSSGQLPGKRDEWLSRSMSSTAPNCTNIVVVA